MDFLEWQIKIAQKELRKGVLRWIHLTPVETPRQLPVWLRQKYPGFRFRIEYHDAYTLVMLTEVP